jgi:hypothetical protein
MAPNEARVTLKRERWRVPERVGPVVPFLAGEEVAWRLL